MQIGITKRVNLLCLKNLLVLKWARSFNRIMRLNRSCYVVEVQGLDVKNTFIFINFFEKSFNKSFFYDAFGKIRLD